MTLGRLGACLFCCTVLAMGSAIAAEPVSAVSPADLNGDGTVDRNDIFLFSRHFDPHGLMLEALGDRNGDNLADQDDLDVLIRHWHRRHLGQPVAPTPMPGEGGIVKGKVITVTRDGVEIPVPAALVELVAREILLRTETDALGQFEFVDVPSGTYVVRASKAGFYYDREWVTLPPGGEVWVDLFLHPVRTDLGSLAGIVRDVTPIACITEPCEGAPIAGALVRLIPLSFSPPLDYEPAIGSGPPDFDSIPGRPAPEQVTRTDERGFYFFPDIPAGDYLVVVVATGYATAQGNTQIVAGRRTFLDFYLEPVPTGVLFGTVTELTGTELPGDPIPRACVHLFPVPATDELANGGLRLDTRLPFTAVTDENGDYRLPPIPAGPYTLVVRAYGYEPFRGEIEIPPFAELRADFQLLPIPVEIGAVAGTVHAEPEDPAGTPAPLEEAIVLLVYCPLLPGGTPADQDTAPLLGAIDVAGIIRRATTGLDGTYRFDEVPVGEYLVVAKKPGFYSARERTTVLVDQTSVVDFVLQRWQEPEFGAVEGHVLEDPGMLTIVPPPIPGALVIIEPWSGADPAEYLREDPSWGGGQPLPGDIAFPRRTLTDEKGYYRFDFLSPGGYRLRVMAEGYLPAVKWARVPPAATTIVDFLLVRSLEPPARVLGRVFEATGTDDVTVVTPPPIPGARVTLFPIWSDVGNLFDDPDPGAVVPAPEDYPGAGVLVAFTNLRGYYEFPQVPPGPYRIVADKEGFRPQAFLLRVPPREVIVQDFFLQPVPLAPYGAVGGQVMAATVDSVTTPPWPIPGAYVFLVPQRHILPDRPVIDPLPPGVEVRVTDAEGRYFFERVEPGAYAVLAYAAGYEPDVREVYVGPGESLRVNFFLVPGGPVPPSRFKGHVFQAGIDPAVSPVPIPGATVYMVPDWPGEVLGSGLDRPVPLYEAVTDDRGYFEFPELPAGEYMLTIVAEGFAEFRDTVLLPPGVEIRRSFYLRPLNLAPALLEGFVREASPASTVGRPIPGAEVTLIMMHVRNGTHYILPGFYRAYTDQEGYYRIEGIQPTAYHVSVSAAGFEPFYGQIELASGDARREDFLLRPALPRPGRVCGVVSSYLGPLAGARVSIPIAGLVLSAETDPQGRYCISNVPAGLQHVVAKKDGYSTEEREVLVPSGGEAVADFFLHPENLPASFSGVVFGATDPAGPAPQPVPGARVELYVVYPPTFAPQFYVTFTDEAGEFRIDGIMAPSICRLTISAVGCNSFVVEEIPFEPGDQIYREFVLRCPAVQTGRMEGRVAADIPGWVGPLLPPIEGAVVQLRPIPLPTGAPELPPPMYEAVTDATGYYVIRGIQPAYYNVMVMAEGFQSADDLALIEAGDTLIRNYALKPLPAGNGSISGRVIVNTTNRVTWPIADAQLTLRQRPDGPVVASTVSNASGAFQMLDIPPGQYLLRAEAKDFFPDERPVEILASQDTHVVIRQLQYTTHVGSLFGVAHWDIPAGTVVGASDPPLPIPVASVPVRLVSLEYFFPEDYPPILLEGMTGPSGDFRFSVVPAGRYMLSIGWSGTVSYSQEVGVPEGDPTYVTITVPAPEAILGSLAGRVLNVSVMEGRAIPGALVRLVPRDVVLPLIFPPPSFGLDAVSDATGYYEIRGIPPGGYFAVVIAEGFMSGSGEFDFRPGEDKWRSFFLEPLEPPASDGGVAGSVSEYTGFLDVFIPIPGALVKLTGWDGSLRETGTGPMGEFVFSGLPAGHYRISAQKEAYRPEEKEVWVRMHEQSWVNFSLHPIEANVLVGD